MVGQTVGPYEIQERLGAGGMGVVYRAFDSRLKRTVALKFLAAEISRDPQARARFEREARAASALDHANIAAVYDIGEHQGSLYIAMAYYPGQTLRQRLLQGRIPPEEAVAVLRQLLEGIDDAHRAGVVHRDLKPENVMLTAAGPVKILDFGLAKLGAEGEDSSTALTSAGTTLGTIAYMSPEQARGEEVDARSDLWSIGVIAYEMVAAVHPFAAPSRVGMLTRIASDEPRPLEQVSARAPAAVVRLVPGLLRKDRAQRIASAAAALSVLRSEAAPAAPKPPPLRRRYPRVLAGAGAVAALAAALLVASRLRSAPAASEPSLVVLPCIVLGAEESRFLTDAVPSTQAAFLAQLPGLDLRKPPTSQQIDPTRADVVALARTFRVASCVTCSVTAQGDTLVLVLDWVQGASRKLLWSQAFEGTRTGYLDLVRRSADALGHQLLPQATLPPGKVGAATSEAELALRRGQHHLHFFNNRRQPADREAALAAFTRALELDPTLAEAAAGIATLHMWSEGEGQMDMARSWARRALEIDPKCGRAWLVLVAADNLTGGDAGWRRQLEEALRGAYFADDGFANYGIGGCLQFSIWRAALAAYRNSTEVEPLYAWGELGVATALWDAGRNAESLDSIRRARELDPALNPDLLT